MSFSKLYAYVQSIEGRVSRKQLRPKILELTGREPRVFHTHMDTLLVRGMFIDYVPGSKYSKWSGGQPCILIARNQDDIWKRFVEIKELMHTFDDGLDRIGTDSDFAQLLEYFTAPGSGLVQQNHLSDGLGVVKALACVCSESTRQEYVRKCDNDEITLAEMARELRIPEVYVSWLLVPNFKSLVMRLIS